MQKNSRGGKSGVWWGWGDGRTEKEKEKKKVVYEKKKIFEGQLEEGTNNFFFFLVGSTGKSGGLAEKEIIIKG